MAETSEQHTAEDLVPIQNFMRRFSQDVDNHQDGLPMEAAAAAAAAKEPSSNDPTSMGEILDFVSKGRTTTSA